jgi:hypothetical protein
MEEGSVHWAWTFSGVIIAPSLMTIITATTHHDHHHHGPSSTIIIIAIIIIISISSSPSSSSSSSPSSLFHTGRSKGLFITAMHIEIRSRCESIHGKN